MKLLFVNVFGFVNSDSFYYLLSFYFKYFIHLSFTYQHTFIEWSIGI